MSAALDTLRSLLPDFGKARRERNKIRKRYRDNLNSVDRDDLVYTISSRDYNPEYLGNRTEKKSTHADHLVQKHGAQSNPNSYRIIDNEEEVKDAMENVVKSITYLNCLSLVTEILFIMVVIFCVSLAVYLAIGGIETFVTQLASMEQTPNTTAAFV